ncbi:SDR family NAD(P)-dependent oxidoreductase [Sporichthya brevicatena]|uniref:SDR family NAD(P)-dependent oxidoreductase n=1 Tax=Sporichthya brevicatena TaxID=171442 RepID=A0ABN1G450_9ACTN
MAEISFQDRVAVVTGAGRGLGKAYATELARRGAKVVVNDAGAEQDGRGGSASVAELVAKEIVAAGGEAVAHSEPIGTPAAGAGVVELALEHFGKVDIVINNAGVLRDKSLAKMPAEDFDLVLDVHLAGSFHVAQRAFAAMKEQGYGRMLFTASGAGLFGNFGQANYSAAKMGLVGLSSVVAIEGARHGITSNVIAPLARTRLTEDMPESMGPYAPEQIAPLSLYLVSEECTATHEVYTAGNGWFAQVFVGVAPGWSPGLGSYPSVEEVRDNMAAIRNQDGYQVLTDAAAILPLIERAGGRD